MKTAESLLTLTADERLVLLTLLQAETLGAVHAIVTAPQLSSLQKTTNIINQLDFCFQLRVSLWNCMPDDVEEPLVTGADLTLRPQAPVRQGEIIITDVERQVLERLVETANEDNLTADVICTLRGVRRGLLLKLSSAFGFLTSTEAAAPGASKTS